jgi:Helicase HerA, central domain
VLVGEATAQSVKPSVRVGILLVSLVALGWISAGITGSIIPDDPAAQFIFQNAILLVVLGSAVIEHKFTKPADAVVNALIGMITLVPLYGQVEKVSWALVFTYCLIVGVLSTTCVAVSQGPEDTGWRKLLANLTYRPAVVFGAARRLYSILFLYAVLAFYGTGSPNAAVLILFWGFFILLWPLGVPEFLSQFDFRKIETSSEGRVVRTDWPNLVRVSLTKDANWSRQSLKTYEQPDGNQKVVLPLYVQVQDDQSVGTGLCIAEESRRIPGAAAGHLYPRVSEVGVEQEIATLLGGDETSRLVGFVIEDSDIEVIRFEIWDPKSCYEGMLIWCDIAEHRVFFQITNGETREEALTGNLHGFQVGTAVQLGTFENGVGFKKFGWVPAMNAPVFSEPPGFGEGRSTGAPEHFKFGTIPQSRIAVAGDFEREFSHHTAILGVTGSGKTELALDLVRHAAERGIKVVCIDLTARYQGELAASNPKDLSISNELATELSQKLFDVETGEYGAGKEKKVLEGFSKKLKVDVEKAVKEFLENGESNIGVIRLEEISNTKATLYITEIYLTSLLHYARDNYEAASEILIVVEEAHTVMPEATTMGLGDFDSRGLVGKIAQIALQGRKYDVGLLVIAQRTATVSKTVLTQCNTIISFSCIDDTSLGFLRNVFGKAHVDLIPNLPPLHAVVFGRAIRSQRPIIIQIPFSQDKADKG